MQHNVRKVFDSHDILPPIIETHRDNINTVAFDILRAFLHEFYSIVQDIGSSEKLTNHTLNATRHFLPEISEATSKIRNTSAKLWHDKQKHSTAPYVVLLACNIR